MLRSHNPAPRSRSSKTQHTCRYDSLDLLGEPIRAWASVRKVPHRLARKPALRPSRSLQPDRLSTKSQPEGSEQVLLKSAQLEVKEWKQVYAGEDPLRVTFLLFRCGPLR